MGFSLSAVEKVIQNPDTRKPITRIYRLLSIQNNECMARVRFLWEADFRETIPNDEWDGVWSRPLQTAYSLTKPGSFSETQADLIMCLTNMNTNVLVLSVNVWLNRKQTNTTSQRQSTMETGVKSIDKVKLNDLQATGP